MQNVRVIRNDKQNNKRAKEVAESIVYISHVSCVVVRGIRDYYSEVLMRFFGSPHSCDVTKARVEGLRVR